MKRLTVREWVTFLKEITAEATERDVPKWLGEFMRVVRVRRALKLLPRIIAAYKEAADTESGTVRIETWAARALPNQITEALQKLGTDVVIDHTINPLLIGGLKLKVGDVIIDGTIATRLKKLYEA